MYESMVWDMKKGRFYLLPTYTRLPVSARPKQENNEYLIILMIGISLQDFRILLKNLIHKKEGYLNVPPRALVEEEVQMR